MKRTFCDCCGNEIKEKSAFAQGKEVQHNLSAHKDSPTRSFRSVIPFHLTLTVRVSQPHSDGEIDLCENCTWRMIEVQDKRPKCAPEPYPLKPAINEILTKFLNDKVAIDKIIIRVAEDSNINTREALIHAAILKTIDTIHKYD